MKKIVLAVSVVALLGALPASAQLDLSRYVALGDSLTAGFTSNGLVDCYQMHSYPAVLASQAGAATFEMPLMSPPGIPPVLELVSLAGGVPTLVPAGNPADAFPYNAAYPLPYNDLGVPGATLYDMLFTTGDINNVLSGNTDNAMHDLILRVPQVPNPVTGEPMDFTAIVQAIALDPTFITLWIGNMDVQGAVTSATPIDGVTMTPVSMFEMLYPQAVGALVQSTDADIVLFTLPDLTAEPFVRTVPPFLDIPGLGVVPIMGSNGPLDANCLVTLLASSKLAQGYGVPLPGYPPLPEDVNLATGEPGYVLRPEEVTAIQERIDTLNAIIVQTADAFGLPVFDVGGVIDGLLDHGIVLGGVHLDGSYLTGGIISYDGVHPQQLAHALLAMYLVDFLNATYDADITPINLGEILFDNPCYPLGGAYGVAAKDVVFSPEATQSFLDLFMPELPRMPRHDQQVEAATD
ncbi:MAG TPA: SGNH/GDSL hydrolase family protein [Thermoanaerobaculales bacterium]|nr:SGNH/GDSL hydrolase family protein [Thermoanaerobaculales bacterium]HPA82852.1 SGNH/GDSL hydrolase family protein [Thermoanaerobaculales bacterium]HQL30960.1 SGNH/GDSL hydrolase family protein [Thermoanaerobaculales bacterium]HQN95708.1 SGNH/GDSL hydrolase family protein [Thermoanaerobaculales bacterium]HQP42120.1 SGNH/GDSL hydrolase family protein [Thermoanaerobaculales bacterium]